MKKVVLMFSMAALLSVGSVKILMAQEQPKPQKDTVNMDTHAKPEFYYAVEDEKSGSKSGSGATICIIAGAVVILGVAGYFLLRKNKK